MPLLTSWRGFSSYISNMPAFTVVKIQLAATFLLVIYTHPLSFPQPPSPLFSLT